VIRKGTPWLLAIGVVMACAGTANADNAPAAGSWRKLAQRHFRLAAPAEPSAADLPDALRVVRGFKPASAKVTDLNVVTPGPKQVPRVSFRSTQRVPISLGVATITKEETVWVRGDVSVRKLKACPYDDGRQGYEIVVGLTDSDEPVAANVSNWAASLCVSKLPDGALDVNMMTFMQIGPDYGTWMAGRLVTDMLIQQTDPLVAAIKGESGTR
jgi:hypothetical protein